MNESLGERAIKTEWFVEELKRRTGMEVVLWDERLTTQSAKRVLVETGVRRENRKDYVDKMAATIILQGYLDYRNKENGNGGEQGEDCHNE
jgi:putative Holliday junction resolvase